MEYKKPQVVAQNDSEGTYAAGCPANRGASNNPCSINCEIRK